jgi:hypothetical protein
MQSTFITQKPQTDGRTPLLFAIALQIKITPSHTHKKTGLWAG